MIKLDVAKQNIKEHNLNWWQIFHHPHRVLTMEVPDLEKQMHYLI